MNVPRVYYHLARADFLERARRYSFLVILAATVYLGYAINRGDFYLRLDDYRGVLNSAWVGGMMATSAIIVLSLFGFYFVKNAVERDMDTGVGQIIATSPISRLGYLLGKWLSNLTVLVALVGILAVAAVIMQVMADERSSMDPTALLLPFLLLVLPAMAVVAALALLFECIPWLRGGLGNVLYFFVWAGWLSVAFATGSWWMDWSGIILVQQSMALTLKGVDPSYSGTFSFTSQALPAGGLHTFEWTGIQWTASLILNRVAWVAGAIGLVVVGIPFFHRFDPTYERKHRRRSADEAPTLEPQASDTVRPESRRIHLEQLAAGVRQSGFSARALAAELRMVVKGQRWWWHMGVVAVIIGGAVSPSDVARGIWLPIAWIWPMLLWSKLGIREELYNTREIVFSSPRPLLRQLPSTWMAGFSIAVVAGGGVALNLLVAADWGALGAWFTGGLFIPSLALALGVWSRTSKPFEILYLLLWYLGPMHAREMPGLDFMGAGDVSIAAGMPMLYALMAVALMGIAVFGRWRQLRA